MQDSTGGLSGSRAMSILGDPTLRATVLPPPTNVGYGSGQMTWSAPDGTGDWSYYVFAAASLSGPWTNVYAGGSTSATVTNPGHLMVRSAKPVTTGSGTFTNLSQGAFYPSQYQ